MSRVVNFLSGDSALFEYTTGSWTITGGSATAFVSREQQHSTFGSMKIVPTASGTVTATVSNVSIPAAYLGWAVKFSSWVWCNADTTVTASLTVTGASAAITSQKVIRASRWTLISILQPTTTTQYGLTGSISCSLSFAGATTSSAFFISNPVAATPDALVYNTFNNELYARLPRFMRESDLSQSNPDFPLLRFMDTVFMEAADVYDLWEDIRYVAPDTYGVSQKKSTLVDPDTIPVGWMTWLASILGVNLLNKGTGYTSWAAMESALDIAPADGVTTWTEWTGGASAGRAWSYIENLAPDTLNTEAELRWQLSTAVSGINAGTSDAIKAAVQHILTGTKSVTLNALPGGTAWVIEIITLASETPDVVGTSSATVVSAVENCLPVGFQAVSYVASSAGEALLKTADLWIDAAKSSASAGYLTNVGQAGSALDARFGSTTGSDGGDPTLLTHTGTNYLYLPGTTGNYVTTPSTAALQISGDLEVAIRMAADGWTPASGERVLIEKPYGASGFYWTRTTAGLLLGYALATNASALLTASVAWTPPVSDGTPLWLKMTRVAATGVVTFYSASDQATEPTTWTTIGTFNGASGSLATNALQLIIGGSGLGVSMPAKYYQAIVRHAGTIVLNANFTTGITSGAQTSFVESSANAATMTINRFTSGRKSVAVTRSVLLFGTNDFLEIAHDPRMQFVAGQNFSAFAIVRSWSTMAAQQTVMSKGDGSAPFIGWYIQNNGGTTSFTYNAGYTSTGATSVSLNAASAHAQGNLAAITFTVDRDNNTARIYKGSSGASATTNVAANPDSVNTLPLRIGNTAANTTRYNDMELVAAGVFYNHKLSDSEVAAIVAHYGAV